MCAGLCVSLLSTASFARADDDDVDADEPASTAPKQETPEELLRRIREEAAKAGVDINNAKMPGTQVQPATPPPVQPGQVQPANPPQGVQPGQVQPANPPQGVQQQPAQTHFGVGQAPADAKGTFVPAAGQPAVTQGVAPVGTPPPNTTPSGQMIVGPRGVPVPAAGGAAPNAGATNGTLMGRNPTLPPGFAGRPDEAFTFNFTDSVELLNLVEFVRDALGLQIIATDGGLRGQTVTLTAPVTIRQDQVLPFIVTLLEEKQYTMTEDFPGVWVVKPLNAVTPSLGSAGSVGSTTRLFQTPNIKPSSLQQAISTVLNTNRGQTPAAQPVYLDDLGIAIITDSPKNLALVQTLIDRLVAERADMKFFKFDLVNIAAINAKDRVMELLGQQAQRSPGTTSGQPGQPVPVQNPAVGGQLTNIGERLTIDPTTNALYFRGREEEREQISQLLALVDTPNMMVAKFYPVGYETAMAVANAGVGQQLGSNSVFETDQGSTSSRGQIQQPGQSGQSSQFAGTGFTIFPQSGGFMYRGTEAQHERVAALVAQLKDLSDRDTPTLEFYKLKHGKSTDVAEIVQNLITNSTPTGNRGSGLLARDANRNRPSDRRPTVPNAPVNPQQPAGAGAPDGALGELNGEDVFVIADEPNNQVIVKAPKKLQPQFRQLISRIDLRRPQVYIDAKIVAVTHSDDFRLAVEAQQIIGQFAFNTNFGLGTLPANSATPTGGVPQGIQSQKQVATSLGGLTSALIRSKDVPLVINALGREIDTRIVATPQVLVDDNEEAKISSVDQQPTSTTTQQAGNEQVTGFAGFEEAGPKLTVKPQISEGGYLRLEYQIELSSFQGSAAAGLPPPKTKNEIQSDSVTIPTDSTIVIGGLTFEQKGRTVVKVPLLGDIPLIGNLFKDQSESKRTTTLYVFITPKIMRDPNFADLRLLTKAPLVAAKLEGAYPEPTAEVIPLVKSYEYEKARREEEAREKMPEEPKSPAGKKPEKTPVRRKAWSDAGDPG